MDVFISYSSKQSDEAHAIKSVLQKNGFSVWMAPESIAPGSNYTKEIPVAIKNCGVFVLVLSVVAQESFWVSAEVETALKNGKFIIPFIIENCSLNDDFDFMLSRAQRIVAFEKKSDALSNLVDAVKRNISDPEKVKSDDSEKKTQLLRDLMNTIKPATQSIGENSADVEDTESKASDCVGAKAEPDEKNVVFGKKTYPDGSVYEGELVDGKANGKGKMVFLSGAVYEGDFVEDKCSGEGKKIFTDGTFYEGEWLNGKNCGKGKRTYSDGVFYEGEWIDGKRNGRGKMTFPDGSFYESEWIAGKRKNKVKMTLTNGAVYEGDLIGDKRNGKGKMILTDGTVYEGEFVNSKAEGIGKITFPDGTFYEGEFVRSLPNGRGKETFADGSFYEGRFVDGNPNGKGKMILADGTIYKGKWTNGKFRSKENELIVYEGNFSWTTEKRK